VGEPHSGNVPGGCTVQSDTGSCGDTGPGTWCCECAPFSAQAAQRTTRSPGQFRIRRPLHLGSPAESAAAWRVTQEAAGTSGFVQFADATTQSTATLPGSQGPQGPPGPEGPPGPPAPTVATCGLAALNQCGCTGTVMAVVSGNDPGLGCAVTSDTGSCSTWGSGTLCCVCVAD